MLILFFLCQNGNWSNSTRWIFHYWSSSFGAVQRRKACYGSAMFRMYQRQARWNSGEISTRYDRNKSICRCLPSWQNFKAWQIHGPENSTHVKLENFTIRHQQRKSEKWRPSNIWMPETWRKYLNMLCRSSCFGEEQQWGCSSGTRAEVFSRITQETLDSDTNK